MACTSDPAFVGDFLGHAKLATTDRYLSLDPPFFGGESSELPI